MLKLQVRKQAMAGSREFQEHLVAIDTNYMAMWPTVIALARRR